MPNLKLKDTLTKYPRSVLDENDDMSALSLSNESVRINGSLEITDVPASEFDTNQYLVLDGDTVKTRNVPGDISSISFTSLDDFSTQNISSGVADFVTDGSNGITTEIAAGPIIKITGEDASTSNKGVAKFNTANFSVSSGDVTIKDGGVDLTAEVTGELPNANVADLPTSKITSGTMADARIASSNVTQHEGDIDAVGVLASGSIASGFGTIVTGNKISTTAGLESAKLDVEAATLTASTAGTDTAIDISQTLNAGSGENNAMVVEKYAMLRGVLTETDAAGWDSKYFMQMVGGSGGDTDKFTVQTNGSVTSASTITSSNGVCSGTGALDTGSSNITTTGDVEGGTITATGPTLTAAGSDDYSIKSEQTLNDTSAAGGTQEYAQINTDLTTTDTTGWDSVYLINQQVGGTSKFRVTSTGAATFASTVTSSNGISGLWCASGNSNVSYRGNTVDYWYVGNQSLGDAITIGDFGTYKFSSAMFTAHHSVQLQAWNLTTTFSSAHDFEVEMWDIEVSAGGSFATSVTKIGATQSVTATALKIYSIGQVGLDYTLAAGHLLFMPIRYTDGSGTFYTYGTVGMEFTNA